MCSISSRYINIFLGYMHGMYSAGCDYREELRTNYLGIGFATGGKPPNAENLSYSDVGGLEKEESTTSCDVFFLAVSALGLLEHC